MPIEPYALPLLPLQKKKYENINYRAQAVTEAWLGHYAIGRNVAGSSPDEVNGFFS
jgi:hypothetical protein